MERQCTKNLMSSINAMREHRWKEASDFFIVLPEENSHARGILNAVLNSGKLRLFQTDQKGTTVLQELLI